MSDKVKKDLLEIAACAIESVRGDRLVESALRANGFDRPGVERRAGADTAYQ